MKKLKKISLHSIGQAELAKKEQSLLKGGGVIPEVVISACGCKYAGPQEGPNDSFYGGSSRADSGAAYGN